MDSTVSAAVAATLPRPAATTWLRRSSLSVVFGALALLLTLGVLGRPSVFPDTYSYVGNGRTFFHVAARKLHLEAPLRAPKSPQEAWLREWRRSLELTITAARSPEYSVALYPIQRWGTIWAVAAVQAVIGAWLIWLLWRTLAPGAPKWTAYAVQATTATFSTLPFLVGFVMPDVFSGFLLTAITLVLVAWGKLTVRERTGLVVLITFASMAHGGNPLLTLAILLAVGLAMALRVELRRQLKVPVCCIIGALSAALTIQQAVNLGIGLTTGQMPGRPPFLTARLLSDGPGRRYLRAACAQGEPYYICRFKDRRLDDANKILWSLDPQQAIFVNTDPLHRLRMAREERRFVLGVVAYDPVGVIAAGVRNWAWQLTMVSAGAPFIDPYLYVGTPEYAQTPLPGMVTRIGSCGPDGHGCRTRMSGAAADILQTTAVALSLGLVALLCWRRRRQPDGWVLAAGLVAFGLVANALIFGALSGPFPRYESMLSWLLVTIAAIGIAGRVSRPTVRS